ncbi:MAG TPA: MBL fold metallo-hydrolase [Candidatus Lokiarchaeia archaeon]|nr:MBL fold metallo-hydrolase [Candidatus Lokiarchaeia archaeon]
MLKFETLVDGIFLVKSDDTSMQGCQGILVKNVADSGNILIDCNFPKHDLTRLLGDLNGNVRAYFATHAHLDHVNNLHLLEKIQPGIDIYCPTPENEYLLDISKFTDDNGAKDFGVAEQMQNIFHDFMKFKELNHVEGFDPGSTFTFGGIVLKTIHLPGHSPGHVAFVIENMLEPQRKILFATDIGLDKFGPWYGFKYNSIKAIQQDIETVEALYMSDDFILTSGHGEIYFEKQPAVFQAILAKIEEKENRLLAMLDATAPKGLEDLALHGLIYRQKTLEKYSKLFPDALKLWYFWEAHFILNLVQDLLDKGKIKEIGTQTWVLDGGFNQ